MARIAELSNARWFTEEFRLLRPDIIDRATKSLLSQDADLHAGMWEMISELDISEQLPAISCPTLVVVGESDINAPLTAGEKIVSLISGASLEVMRGVGHFPPVEEPQIFNDLLRRFLSSVDA